MTGSVPLSSTPANFAYALAEIKAARWRPEIQVEEIPAPSRIAPFSVALSADVISDGITLGDGRLILLHDPSGNTAWQGEFRCVVFAKSEIDFDMTSDPLILDAGWSWLQQSLAEHECAYTEPSGTVTVLANKSFGALADHSDSAELEVRASWTPLLTDTGTLNFQSHLAAWGMLLSLSSGLPLLPHKITELPPRNKHR